MKLSVCIFTYNHECYISETLESVLMQKTNFDYEIVVGEDCSTDRTAQIVQSYEQKYPGKIRALFNPVNLGMMENNCRTILQCKGEYIALLDGDDYWISNNKLQAQVDFLETHPDFVFCFHDGKILKVNGTFDRRTCCDTVRKKVVKFGDVICDVHIPTFSIVFRRKAIHGYPPEWFKSLNAPDRPLFLLLSAVGPGFYFDHCWGVYRKHLGGCWTGQDFQRQSYTHLQIYDVLNSHFNNRYIKGFCHCESRIYYELAMAHIEVAQLSRGLVNIRKFVRTDKQSIFFNPRMIAKVTIFAFHYIRKILWISLSRDSKYRHF